MEFLLDFLADSLLHPAVLVSAVVVSAALLSGLVARVLQVLDGLTVVWGRLGVRALSAERRNSTF
jgi:hypothetical protein